MTGVRFNGSYIGGEQILSKDDVKGVNSLAAQAVFADSGLWPLDQYRGTAFTNLVEGATPQLINIYGELSVDNNVSLPYYVTEISFTPITSGTKTFYIGYKIPDAGVSTFYHDYTIAQLDVRDSSGILAGYYDIYWTGFQTTTDTSTDALTVIPTSLTFTNVAVGATRERFNIDSAGTGSGSTGMLNGVQNYTGGLPSGGQPAYQTSGQSYLYVESSGMSVGGRVWLRKLFPVTFSTSETYSIRVAHYLNTTDAYADEATALSNTAAIYIT